MDSSHIPSTPTAAMHTNASTARPTRRDTRQPINAANPATIHHGTSVSRFFNGSSAYFTVTLVMAVVTPPNVRVIHDNASFTGALDVDRPRRREVLLAQDLATDEDRDGHEGERHDRGGEPRRSRPYTWTVVVPRRFRSRAPHADVVRSSTIANADDGEAAGERHAHVQVVEAVETPT